MTTQLDTLPHEAQQHKLINKKQRNQLCQASEMSFWRWEQKGIWPKRIKIGGRNYWRLAEVLEAIDKMAKGGE